MFNLTQQAALGLSQHHLVSFQNRLVEAEVVVDLNAMISAAKQDGIDIAIASSFRDFKRQSLIWNNKFNGVRPVYDKTNQIVDLSGLTDIQKCHHIMLFSAMPGASRHHFGTDLDIFDRAAVSPEYQLQLTPSEYDESGPFFKLNLWLQENALQFGFFLPYKTFKGGVAAEPWHISHKIRSQHYAKSHNAELLQALLNHSDVAGWQCLTKHMDHLYAHYVSNINLGDSV